MPEKQSPRQIEKPSDKFAQSDQAPPPGKRRVPQFLSDRETEGVVDGAAADSFPASDPPAHTRGRDAAEHSKGSRAGS